MTVLIIVTLLVWIAAFLIPSGTYERDENGIPEPGSYQQIDSPQDFGERVGDFFLAPVNGLYGLQDPETGVVVPFGVGRLFGAVGVFLFVLAIGAFMTMVLATGALDVAIGKLAYAVQGRPWLVIVAVMALFSLLGTTMGWADETLGFYALLIPLMLALGYDRMAAAGMIIGSATVGAMASTVNPFSIGVASEFADVGIGDGIGLRWIGWFVLTTLTIAYVVRYAERVKAQPDALPRRLHGRGHGVDREGAVGLRPDVDRPPEARARDHDLQLRPPRLLRHPLGLDHRPRGDRPDHPRDRRQRLLVEPRLVVPGADRAVPGLGRRRRRRRGLQREGDHGEHRAVASATSSEPASRSCSPAA